MIAGMKCKVEILMFALILLLSACAKVVPGPGADNDHTTWQEQYDLGVRYLSEGNYEGAIIAFTAAIEIDPKQAQPFIGRAQTYVLSGEKEESLASAQADFETALRLDETIVDAWLGLADVYIRCGNYIKAEEILKEGLEKTGNARKLADKLAEMEQGRITDLDGKIRMSLTYDAKGKLLWYHKYTYEAGDKISGITSYDGNNVKTGHVDYDYDESGNAIKMEGGYSLDDGILTKEEIRQYDQNGNCVRVEIRFLTGEMESYIEIEYNDENRMIKRIWHTPDTNVSSYDTYEYNGSGEVSVFRSYLASGELNCYWQYSYVGSMTRVDYYNGDGTTYGASTWENDANGNELHRIDYDGDGNIIFIYDDSL